MDVKFGLSHQGEVRTLIVSENSAEDNISSYYKREKSQEVGENSIMMSFLVCT
jgi:hypothetical protein